jgi:hypothetical protein
LAVRRSGRSGLSPFRARSRRRLPVLDCDAWPAVGPWPDLGLGDLPLPGTSAPERGGQARYQEGCCQDGPANFQSSVFLHQKAPGFHPSRRVPAARRRLGDSRTCAASLLPKPLSLELPVVVVSIDTELPGTAHCRHRFAIICSRSENRDLSDIMENLRNERSCDGNVAEFQRYSRAPESIESAG